MGEKRGRRFDSGLIMGLIIVAVGALLLLDRLDLGVNISLRVYWPSLLIIFGIYKIWTHRFQSEIITGALFAVVGTLFQLNNLHYISFWWGDLWPLLIIFAGIMIVLGSFGIGRGKSWCCSVYTHRHHRKHKSEKGEKYKNGHYNRYFSDSKEEITSDHIDLTVLFGGGDHRVTSQKFKGGTANATFGGLELDLRNAEIEGDSAVIHATALFGAVEIQVPTHWEIVLQGIPVLGAMENKSNSAKDAVKKLIIKGSATFGAVEIK